MVKRRISKKIINMVRCYGKRLSDEEKLPVDKVIIFGSQAKGKAHKWSDIDVCIISPKFKDFMKTMAFLFQKRKDNEVMGGLEPVGFSKKDFEEGSSLIQEIKKPELK